MVFHRMEAAMRCGSVLDADVALRQLDDQLGKQTIEFGISLDCNANKSKHVLPGIEFVSSMRGLPGFQSVVLTRANAQVPLARP